MERKIILTIELIALFICIVSGILWIMYPSEPYEPTFAFSAFTFVGTEVYRRLRPKKNNKHSFLDIDTKNTILCKYMDSDRKKGHISLLFYGLKIVNISAEPFTIKDIKLEYTYKSKKHSTISTVIITGTVFSPQTKENMNSLIVYFGINQAVLMGWDNIRTKIGEHKIIERNGVLTGSALFILEFKELEDIRDITDFQIVVSDYSKKFSKHPIKIEEDWIIRGKNSFVQPRHFTTDEKGKIIYTSNV